jgi:antitoxin HicB
VAVAPVAAPKVALYRAMREHGLSEAALARWLGIHAPQVDRLLDLRHGSRLDQLADALRALGRELVVSVRDAA